MITAQQIQALRTKTGVGMLEAREALRVANGDETLAIEHLRKTGAAAREKRADKKASEGMIYSYVHAGNRVGVILEINSETDFVSKSEPFAAFVKDVALHIVASKPKYINRSEVPQEEVEKEKEIIRAQLNEETNDSMKAHAGSEVQVNKVKKTKPAHIIEQIVEGKLGKFYSDVVLMEQQFVKNPDFTIEELLGDLVLKVKENIVIKRFSVWSLGE